MHTCISKFNNNSKNIIMQLGYKQLKVTQPHILVMYLLLHKTNNCLIINKQKNDQLINCFIIN